MGHHISVFSNPVAGKGRGRAVTEVTIAALRARGADTTELAAHALRDDPTILVAVVGEGTLSETLQAALDSDVPLAIIPAGTGNDVARALGIPRAGRRARAAAATCVQPVGRR